jgi:hypothetical protein
MITEVENIILNKEYFELSTQELESVSELVQNAEEYDEMKWFLASTHEVLISERVEATPELKQKVLNHLNQDEGKRKFWLNGVGVFLWPTDKEFFRRPAFQMSLAALLLIGFLMINDRNLEVDGMAVNDTTISDVETNDKEFSAEEKENAGDSFEQNLSLESDETIESRDVAGGGAGLDSEANSDGGELMVNEPLVVDKSVTEETFDITDMDGYYEPAENEPEFEDVDDEEVISKTNANNNEGKYRNEAIINQDSDKDYKKNHNGYTGKDRFKKGDKAKDKKTNTDYYNNGNIRTTNDEVVLNEKISADSLTTTGSNNNETTSNLGGASNPSNTGIYNTATIDGNYGMDSPNDFLPEQMRLNDTKELKKLFRTFK